MGFFKSLFQGKPDDGCVTWADFHETVLNACDPERPIVIYANDENKELYIDDVHGAAVSVNVSDVRASLYFDYHAEGDEPVSALRFSEILKDLASRSYSRTQRVTLMFQWHEGDKTMETGYSVDYITSIDVDGDDGNVLYVHGETYKRAVVITSGNNWQGAGLIMFH